MKIFNMIRGRKVLFVANLAVLAALALSPVVMSGCSKKSKDSATSKSHKEPKSKKKA